jgi:hypothetical protein
VENRFIVNIIHRPEMVPEYAKTVLGKKAKDNREAFLNESLDIFKLQQDIAHRHGLKTTIQMTYASLFNDEAVRIAKEHHCVYGDELSLTLLGLPCKEFNEKYQTKDFCIWMFSKEQKRNIIDDAFTLFKNRFGFYPTSTGSYYLDAYSISYIKSKYPDVVCAVATCWEEGPKAYHTTNNSWYTFMDGGPWNPWIPSKINTHVPAQNEAEDSGIVAIPHLSRDLLACFDGNGSNFGTHPQNVLRGMIYQDDELPYLFNLIDQYRHLGKYNRGYSYNMMFVGPGWMNKLGRWEVPYDLLVKSYEDGLSYYAKLKQNGQLIDMTMSEFAFFYRQNKSYLEPEVALWKDILYGSDKQYLWYLDPFFRTCLDFNQGGAIIDLRPYVAKLDIPVGIDTDNPHDVTYPYLIQANYRAGYFTHYAGEGTIKSCKVIYNGEKVDLCLTRTMAQVTSNDQKVEAVTNPVTISFSDLDVVIRSCFTFVRGTGEIAITREIMNDLHGKVVTFEEYATLSYGKSEYAENMKGVVAEVKSERGDKTLSYEYKNRSIIADYPSSISATIPQVDTIVTMSGDAETGIVYEGYAFSPVIKLVLRKALSSKEAMTTCLKLAKAS